MTKYPKGARWYVIADGKVTGMIKTQNQKGIKELFFDEHAALNWAEEYYARLKENGWRDSPEDIAPSSVA